MKSIYSTFVITLLLTLVTGCLGGNKGGSSPDKGVSYNSIYSCNSNFGTNGTIVSGTFCDSMAQIQQYPSTIARTEFGKLWGFIIPTAYALSYDNKVSCADGGTFTADILAVGFPLNNVIFNCDANNLDTAIRQEIISSLDEKEMLVEYIGGKDVRSQNIHFTYEDGSPLLIPTGDRLQFITHVIDGGITYTKEEYLLDNPEKTSGLCINQYIFDVNNTVTASLDELGLPNVQVVTPEKTMTVVEYCYKQKGTWRYQHESGSMVTFGKGVTLAQLQSKSVVDQVCFDSNFNVLACDGISAKNSYSSTFAFRFRDGFLEMDGKPDANGKFEFADGVEVTDSVNTVANRELLENYARFCIKALITDTGEPNCETDFYPKYSELPPAL